MSSGDSPNITPLSTVNKFRASLQSEDRRVRKAAFEDLSKYVSECDPATRHRVFNETNVYILNGLRDKSEPVREAAIEFLSAFITKHLPINDYYLSYVFPVLTERLAASEIIEESEEIRLQLVTFLEKIIDQYSSEAHLKQFLNDSVSILRETLKDKYPAIKEKSCVCVVKLTQALPRDFHLQAESLVKPILSNFGHQRFKIRCEAILCVGEVIMHCSYKGLDEVVGPMAERLFDQVPAVRRAVARVAAKWLLGYRDRYSFFHKLLPLILTGLNDEIPETRAEAHQLWLKIGLQYQKENEDDLKDELDYLLEPPKHYLPNVERPNLGCRILVKRNVSKLAKGIANELNSWQQDVKVRIAQLLVSVVLHAEEGLTHNLQDLLPGMYWAAKDEDSRVVENVIKASEIIGLFVPIETWKKLVIPTIEDGPHYGHLAILSGLINGTPIENIKSHLAEFGCLLAQKEISQSRKPKYQRELINCCNALMHKFESSENPNFGSSLFTIILTMIALKDIENNTLIDLTLFDKLGVTLKFETKYDLWVAYSGIVLDSIKNSDPKAWTVVTPERCMFEVFLLESEEAFGRNLDVIGEILVDALDIDGDGESRLRTFIALTKAMDSKDVVLKYVKGGDLTSFLEVLVVEVLCPSLVWRAGRTAEAIRTAAASCLFSALSPDDGVELFADARAFRPLFDKLLPLLVSLTQDASHASRALAVRDLALLKETAARRGSWRVEDLVAVYPEAVKRLDDPNARVRVASVEALRVLLEDPPREFLTATYGGHHGYLVDTLLVHFDDADEDDGCGVRESIGGLLRSLGMVCGALLVGKLEKQKGLFRNEKGCEEVLGYLRDLKLDGEGD